MQLNDKKIFIKRALIVFINDLHLQCVKNQTNFNAQYAQKNGFKYLSFNPNCIIP